MNTVEKENSDKTQSKQVQIPITVARDNLINNIVDAINNMSLPFFIVEDCLKGILNDIHVLSEKQLEHDKKEYQKSLEMIQSEHQSGNIDKE